MFEKNYTKKATLRSKTYYFCPFHFVSLQNITYDTFVYDNNILEEFSLYKYVGIYMQPKLDWNYIIEKGINGGWKDHKGIENHYK